MDKKEILLNLKKKILNGECNLENLVSELDINELEVLGMVKELKDNGENISVTRKKDGVYIEDFGDIATEWYDNFITERVNNFSVIASVDDVGYKRKLDTKSIYV